MLTSEQIELRKTGITATDIVTLAGLNPYGKLPCDIWFDKKGYGQTTEQSEAMALGDYLEPFIANYFCRETGHIILEENPGTIIHPNYSWVLATPDRVLLDAPDSDRRILECKNVGSFMVKDWDATRNDGIPAYVMIQVQWQLFATGLEVGYVAALLGGTRFFYWTIQCDQAIIDRLFEIGKKFYEENLLGNVCPTPYESYNFEMAEPGTTIDATPELTIECRKYAMAETIEKRAKEVKERIKRGLIAVIGPSDGIKGLVTYKETKRGSRQFLFKRGELR